MVLLKIIFKKLAKSIKIRTKAQTILWGEENTGKLEMINIREY